MKKNIYKIILSQLLISQFVFASEAYKKGLLEATPEQKQKMKLEYREIHNVYPNELGLERLNNDRQKHGMSPIHIPTRKKGEETDVISPSGSSTNMTTSGTVTTTTITTAVPGSVDNSLLASFPPISSQGVLNSCVAFSSTYYQMTHNVGYILNLNNKNTNLTNKFSTKFVYNIINNGNDNGSYAYDAFRVLQYHGAPMLSQWPYDSNFRAWPTTSDIWKSAMTYRMAPIQTISGLDSSTGLTNLKAILNNGYVVTVATWIDSWQYDVIKNDPSTTYDDSEVGKNAVIAVNGKTGGHMLTIVGYNDNVWLDLNHNGIVDSGEKGALRLANSWGTGWQDQGYVWVSYDALKSLSAVTGAPNLAGRTQFSQDNSAYHFVPQINAQKKLIAEVTLSHAKRNQITLRYGSSAMASSSASTFISPGFLQNQGGAYAFDGSTTEIPATFAFDISDLAGTTPSAQKYYFEVNDNTLSDSVQVRDIRITDLTGKVTVANDTLYPTSFDATKKTFSEVSSYNDGTQTLPASPGSLKVSPNPAKPSSSLNITWSDLATNESGYLLEQSFDGANYYSIQTLGANSTATTVNGLNASSTSYYRLTAANGAGTTTPILQSGQTSAPDTVAPVVSLTYVKNLKTATFTANATDNVGVVKVEFWLDGKLFSTTSTSPYTSSVSLRNITLGTHKMDAKAYDASGNIGVGSISFTK